MGTGPTKLSGLRVGSAAGKSSSLAKSLKSGATKSKGVSLGVSGEREANLEVCLSWEEGNQQLVKIPLPPPGWLVSPPPSYDMEQYAELLLFRTIAAQCSKTTICVKPAICIPCPEPCFWTQ